MGMSLDEKGNLVYLMDGNCSIHRRLPLIRGIDQAFTLFGQGVPQRMVDLPRKPSLVFNQIADPDTHRGALERCVELCDHIGTTVINHPRHVLRTGREQVSEALQDIPGVIMPRTWRFQPGSPDEVLAFAAGHGVEFPFLTRVAGKHHGRNMARVDHAEDFAGLHPLPFDGRDFYLAEYVDYPDNEGLYHKQRIVVIDGEPLLRHSLYMDNWMVHSESRAFMMERETWEDDIARFDHLSSEVLPTLRPAIDEITRRLQLEFYGIDCNIRPDGQLLIFEANANMNVLHGPNAAIRYRVKAIENQLYRMLANYSGERVI
jgi:glutathione synthase/RimK-type ligase-like ATP-grasp enzyme